LHNAVSEREKHDLRLFLEANSIEIEDKEFKDIEISGEDESKIVELAKTQN